MAGGQLHDGHKDPLFSRLACPNCKCALSIPDDARTARKTAKSNCIRCEGCRIEFSAALCGDITIPWLFPNPGLAHLEWSARFKGYLQSASNEHNRLNRSLNDPRLSHSGRRRIANTLRAKREHRRQVSDLLEPVDLDAEDLVPAMTLLLEDSLPKNQGLLSYADNVFRDWAWNNGENDALLSCIEGLVSADSRESLGSVVILGAGAGRLAYDIHREYSPTLSVLLDINPLLLTIGCRAIQGLRVSLFEFPIAPMDEDSGAVLQTCCAPEAMTSAEIENFRFVLGDATRPPFAPECFDTVVTPWLVDILPHDLREFLPQINHLLPVGGLWINTGTLTFFSDDPCRRYSEKEVLEQVEAAGFDIVGIDHRTIPYLKSPHSGHGRTERVTSFAAKKRDHAKSVRPSAVLPDWILDTTLRVPASPEVEVASSSHLLSAQVLAAVDGKRSVDAISRLVSRDYNLPIEECYLAVKRALLNSHRFRENTRG